MLKLAPVLRRLGISARNHVDYVARYQVHNGALQVLLSKEKRGSSSSSKQQRGTAASCSTSEGNDSVQTRACEDSGECVRALYELWRAE